MSRSRPPEWRFMRSIRSCRPGRSNGMAGVVRSQSRRLGFTHALIAPPFAPGPSGDPYSWSAINRKLHPALGERDGGGAGLQATWPMAARAARGLRLLLDVPLDRVAADWRRRRRRRAGRVRLSRTPRACLTRAAQDGGLAVAALTRSDDAGRGTSWWIAQTGSNGAPWALAGFRLLGLPHRRAPLRSSTSRCAQCDAPTTTLLLIGWTPGTSRPSGGAAFAIGTGEKIGLVASSLPWWDFSGCLVHRRSRQLRVRSGRSIASVELPRSGCDLAAQVHEPGALRAAYRRALWVAASQPRVADADGLRVRRHRRHGLRATTPLPIGPDRDRRRAVRPVRTRSPTVNAARHSSESQSANGHHRADLDRGAGRALRDRRAASTRPIRGSPNDAVVPASHQFVVASTSRERPCLGGVPRIGRALRSRAQADWLHF